MDLFDRYEKLDEELASAAFGYEQEMKDVASMIFEKYGIPKDPDVRGALERRIAAYIYRKITKEQLVNEFESWEETVRKHPVQVVE